jgi:hypothetical protein
MTSGSPTGGFDPEFGPEIGNQLVLIVLGACWLATLIGTILRLPDRPRLRSVPVGVLALQPVVIVIAHFSMAPGLAGLQ